MNAGVPQIVMPFVAGALLGGATWAADQQNNALEWFGSMTAPWVLVAFVIGATSGSRSSAVLRTTAAMLSGITVYYGLMGVLHGGVNLSYFLSHTVVWLLIAPLAGAVVGLAGNVWRLGKARHSHGSAVALALPAGIALGESVFWLLSSSRLDAGEFAILFGVALIGILLPAVMLRNVRSLAISYGVIIPIAAAGVLVVPAVRTIASVLS